MEELKYIIDDKIIAEILGNQNFSTKESAILELIKNAYDAGASNVEIKFADNELHIVDDGCGMLAKDIKESWMYIGRSLKKYDFQDNNSKTRIYAGSKGIGRFALSRLGEDVSVYSKVEDNNGIHWHTDWERNTLDDYELRNTHGTTIVIRQLRDKWTEKSIELLKSFLSRTYNSDLMTIKINFNGNTETISKYFSEPKLGINCLSYFYLEYDATATILKYSIYSDEFNDEAAKYTDGKKLKFQEDSIDISNQLFDDELDVEPEEIPKLIKEIGSFNARIFFSMKGVSDVDKEKFCYKHKELLERYQEGIILYRNAFSIASYEGRKDWLELGKRSRKSPAAATHETGSWRVRENQVSGYVKIDKQENNLLRDLSNRQGIEENIYYKLFVKILQHGIAEFESYRQKIIRDIDKKNAKSPIKATPYIDKAVKTPGSVHKLDAVGLEGLVKEIQQVKKEQAEGEKRNKETEEKFKYDIRILNMLSTIGLRASSIAHEMQNDRNNISDNYKNIVEALKEYDVWEILNSSENTRYAYKNVPKLLEKNKKINEKILRFMNTMLSNIEKEQFLAKELNMISVLGEIKSVWERDYTWINITIPSEPIYIVTAEDVIKVLIDNLILNSVQQNENKKNLKVTIEAQLIASGVLIKYKDEGVGLPKKYKLNPRKILEVHESSRKNGHGLGMWIINNTLVMSGGRVEDIPVRNEGFEIQMILGEKL